jgi:hypothetical protein
MQKSLIPILKLRERKTHPDRSQHIQSSIVKIEELICSNGKPNMRMVQEIKDAGGLREFLDTSSRIIFTFIMPDYLLDRLKMDTCNYLFEEFQPDSYITMDAPTYAGCEKYSRTQIDLLVNHTAKLMRKFPDYIPIGLVKGCNSAQMCFHAFKLRELGVKQFCLHAGDCSYSAPIYAQDLIVDCGRSLAEKVPYLLIYGVGSKYHFQRFHFANSFATNSHYIQAVNHMVIRGTTWTNFKGKFTKRIVMENFNYLKRLVEKQGSTQQITKWVSEAVDNKQVDKFAGTLTLDRRIVKIMEN